MPLSIRSNPWTRLIKRSLKAATRKTARAGTRAVKRALKPALDAHKAPPGDGDWIAGTALGLAGSLRYRLYRPPGIRARERRPLMVMLHGCGQDARRFAVSTRMNRLAQRERFFVLYPEQDRLANAQGCWNWFDTQSGRAYTEAALILRAIEQVCTLYPVDRDRVALAGLSSGASMAALLGARHPERFRAVIMHSGVPPGTAHSAVSAIGAMGGHRSTAPLELPPARNGVMPWTAGASNGWPPLLVIHGSADLVVRPANGHNAAAVWAEAVRARERAPRRVQRGKRHAMDVTDFVAAGRKRVSLVIVQHLGHAWSGGAAREPYSDARGPDASRMAWAFAARQFELGPVS